MTICFIGLPTRLPMLTQAPPHRIAPHNLLPGQPQTPQSLRDINIRRAIRFKLNVRSRIRAHGGANRGTETWICQCPIAGATTAARRSEIVRILKDFGDPQPQAEKNTHVPGICVVHTCIDSRDVNNNVRWEQPWFGK